MAGKNITIAGATFNGVPSIDVPVSGGGTASFVEISDTTAQAADVASGKYFYDAAGVKTEGTASGGGVDVEALTVTQNGTYTAPSGKAYSPVTVNVSGGGGLTLINTTALGELSTTSTNAQDTGKTISLASSTNWDDYDLLIVDISVDSQINGRHTSTVSLVFLLGTSDVTTKDTYSVGSNKWNSKLSSTGTASTRQYSTAYGVYVNSVSVSGDTLSLSIYYRYNNNSTYKLNGTYTARVYGVKLIDLIGG